MSTVLTTVNINVKTPITEETLVSLIKNMEFDDKWIAHIFNFFTDVPLPDFVFFCKIHSIDMKKIKAYYDKYVSAYYSNKSLEEFLENE